MSEIPRSPAGRPPGLSVRLKLTLSYTGVVGLVGILLLGVVWVFLLRYVPDRVIAGAEFIPNRSDLLEAFLPRAALAFALLLVVGAIGGWLLAGRMLAPLRRITDATRLAGTGSLSHRIALEGAGDEFRELADSFDGMLARLEAHDAEQRRFAANASHELRTPLAVTQAMLDVARDDPDVDLGELVERLRVVNRRAIDLTEALLILSRSEQRAFVRERVDLSLLADEAAETLLPLAEARNATIEMTGAIAPTLGSRALLLQLTTNLVQNAIVHNLPRGGTVWVATSGGHEGAMLVVENTGEPQAPDTLPTLLEPFQRGANRARTDGAGVGLGLAIVRSIADAHDGVVELAPRAGGGLRVTVRFPAAASVREPRDAGGQTPAAEVVGVVGDTGFEPVTPRM